MGPHGVDTCVDCCAWGATRHRGWRCIACQAWRQTRPLGTCRSCQRPDLPVSTDGGCRLCRKQRTRVLADRPWPTPDVVDANRHGQQLFLADMFRLAVTPPPRTPVPRAVPVPVVLPRPDRQEPLFAWPSDLRRGREVGFPPPPDPAVTDALIDRVEHHGARFGWSRGHTDSIRGAIKILLGLQQTPGARIRASEVKALAQLGYSVPAVTAVLIDADMFDDDQEPAVVAWFHSQTLDLPEAMRDELAVWFDVMRNGSALPPRRRPRHDATTVSQLRYALPALRAWAQSHESLREITNDHIREAVPASGSARALRLQAFRSIFRILKARQLVFVNPTARFKARAPDHPAPGPVDLAQLRAALDDRDPPRAAVAALLAFHASRVMDLRTVKVTDLRDGRLRVGDRTILLAEPARDCLTAYLDHRNERWPNTINPHLFINRRSALHDRPVNQNWVRDTLGMAPNTVRRDRIFEEALATGGDLRQLTDLFGVSVATADRFATFAHRAQDAERAGR